MKTTTDRAKDDFETTVRATPLISELSRVAGIAVSSGRTLELEWQSKAWCIYTYRTYMHDISRSKDNHLAEGSMESESPRPVLTPNGRSDGSGAGGGAADDSPAFPPPPPLAELMDAAATGDIATLSSALSNPLVDPNMTSSHGWTMLMFAAINGDDSSVKLLLADDRVDRNIACTNGSMVYTALQAAACGGHMLVLKLLLADDRTIRTRPYEGEGDEYYDAALAWVNRQGTNAEAAPEELIIAAEKGDEATVASALRNPLVDPNMADSVGYTAITSAFQCGHTSVLRLLLADDRVDPNITDQAGNTVLSLAASEMNISHLKLLLANERTLRIRPNDPTGGEYYDAALAWLNRQGTDAEAAQEELIPAARDGDGPMVASALRNPLVDPNILNQRGLNACFYAAWKCRTSVLELLLADHRAVRVRPPRGSSSEAQATRATYDAALRNVKRRRRARFKGLVRTVVVFRRMRLRAAQAVYAPGGAGFAVAAASFQAALDQLG